MAKHRRSRAAKIRIEQKVLRSIVVAVLDEEAGLLAGERDDPADVVDGNGRAAEQEADGLSFDMSAILSALPPGIPQSRLELFRCLLFPEWWDRELLRHRCEFSESGRLFARERARVRAERRDLVRRRAADLRDAMAQLDGQGRFDVACALASGEPKSRPPTPGEVEARLAPFGESLATLAAMAPENFPGARWKQPARRGHPPALLQDAVMLDLAELFESATGTAPRRRVHTEDWGADAGREYGPFWDFARAVWVQVFGSDAGLSAAIRRWWTRRKSGARSPVIANIASRHPGGLTDPRHPLWGLMGANRPIRHG